MLVNIFVSLLVGIVSSLIADMIYAYICRR